MKRSEIESKFTVPVTLLFENIEDRDFFMGGLSDGFGEGACSLEWPWEEFTEQQRHSGEAFETYNSYGVTVFRDEDE